jgi:FKBP-type peptidyl-prolyl cis-trans isomerase
MNKTSYMLIGVVALILIIGGYFMFQDKNGGMTMTPSGLGIEDVAVGTGVEAVPGKLVTVNYSGTLSDGKKFDSSYDRGQPSQFVLGAGQVIQGWDEGVAGMKAGGKRKLTIPPELGYGNQNVGDGLIPPNSTLIFEVELLDAQSVN